MHRIIETGAFRFGVSLSGFTTGAPRFGGENAPDFLVYSFNAFNEINLEDEISGATGHIKDLTAQSGAFGSAIFCGVRTVLHGAKHIGAVVAGNGKLIDIVDRTANPAGDEFETGSELKIFKSAAGRIGLFLDADCRLDKNWERTAPLADIILCLSRGSSESTREKVRLLSVAHKIPYLYIDEESAEWKT